MGHNIELLRKQENFIARPIVLEGIENKSLSLQHKTQ